MTKLKFREDTHEYSVNGKKIPSVTQVLQEVGLVDFSNVNPEVLKQAADFGQKAHDMTALYDKDVLDVFSLDAPLVPYLEAWKLFLKDTKFKPRIIEKRMYSEKYKFAGTPDRVGLIGKDITIVDIKTGVMMYAAAIQTAGYELLCPFRVTRRMSVHLLGNGTYKVEEYRDKSHKTVFLSCLNVTNFKRREGVAWKR